MRQSPTEPRTNVATSSSMALCGGTVDMIDIGLPQEAQAGLGSLTGAPFTPHAVLKPPGSTTGDSAAIPQASLTPQFHIGGSSLSVSLPLAAELVLPVSAPVPLRAVASPPAPPTPSHEGPGDDEVVLPTPVPPPSPALPHTPIMIMGPTPLAPSRMAADHCGHSNDVVLPTGVAPPSPAPLWQPPLAPPAPPAPLSPRSEEVVLPSPGGPQTPALQHPATPSPLPQPLSSAVQPRHALGAAEFCPSSVVPGSQGCSTPVATASPAACASAGPMCLLVQAAAACMESPGLDTTSPLESPHKLALLCGAANVTAALPTSAAKQAGISAAGALLTLSLLASTGTPGTAHRAATTAVYRQRKAAGRAPVAARGSGLKSKRGRDWAAPTERGKPKGVPSPCPQLLSWLHCLWTPRSKLSTYCCVQPASLPLPRLPCSGPGPTRQAGVGGDADNCTYGGLLTQHSGGVRLPRAWLRSTVRHMLASSRCHLRCEVCVRLHGCALLPPPRPAPYLSPDSWTLGTGQPTTRLSTQGGECLCHRDTRGQANSPPSPPTPPPPNRGMR